MIKTILAHLSGTAIDQSVLAMSLDVARLYTGHIECLYVAVDPADLVRQASQIDITSSTMLVEALSTIESQNKERRERARASFSELCKQQDIARADEPPCPGTVSISLRETAGDEADCLAAEARFHDLVVLAGGAARDGRLPSGVLGQIVVSSGRPVLLAPEKIRTRRFKTLAIAWKNTAESARAMTAAMPLLAKAAHVEVLSANEENAKALECVNCSDSIVRQLHWHGLNARGHFVLPAGRSIPDAILETARRADADLLVMGGYGHSRLREFIFGGFTQRILDGVDLPVLLFH